VDAVAQLKAKIRDVPDFPKKGINFKDITTLLKDGPAFQLAIETLAERLRPYPVDVVVGMESRGFIFAAPIAYLLGVGFVPVRKIGKLPTEAVSVQYDLEYGAATLEMHVDGVGSGQRVLVVDDLLATGGTVCATIELVEKLGGSVSAAAFLVELDFLQGRARLQDYNVISLIHYP